MGFLQGVSKWSGDVLNKGVDAGWGAVDFGAAALDQAFGLGGGRPGTNAELEALLRERAVNPTGTPMYASGASDINRMAAQSRMNAQAMSAQRGTAGSGYAQGMQARVGEGQQRALGGLASSISSAALGDWSSYAQAQQAIQAQREIARLMAMSQIASSMIGGGMSLGSAFI